MSACMWSGRTPRIPTGPDHVTPNETNEILSLDDRTWKADFGKQVLKPFLADPKTLFASLNAAQFVRNQSSFGTCKFAKICRLSRLILACFKPIKRLRGSLEAAAN